MANDRFFDYYYGRESEQFTFFRIPKLLITDAYFSALSAEAKLLYGLLMDRMNLSRRNAWYDDQGRVFIMYPIREIQEDLCIGKNTACKLFKQLESVGLVERVRRGLGLPDLIYVKNFASGERPGEPEYDDDLGDPTVTSTLQPQTGSASASESVDRRSSIRSAGRRFYAVKYSEDSDVRGSSGEHISGYAGSTPERAVEKKPVENKHAGGKFVEKKHVEKKSVESIAGSYSCDDGLSAFTVPDEEEFDGTGKPDTGNSDKGNSDKEKSDIENSDTGNSVSLMKASEIYICNGKDMVASQEDQTRSCGNEEKVRENSGDSGSLKSKPQDSRSLERKPQSAGGLKSKPLVSPNSRPQKFKNQTSGVPKSGTLRNNNEINNNYVNNNYRSKSSSSICPVSTELEGEEAERETIPAGKSDPSDYSSGLSYPELVEAVKEKIEYDALVFDYGESEVSIFPHLIAEVLYKCREGRQIVIGGNTYQPEILKARYLEINMMHIRHILYLMQEEHIAPRNLRNYYIQVLYDTPMTIEAYYARLIDHNMHMGLSAVGA